MAIESSGVFIDDFELPARQDSARLALCLLSIIPNDETPELGQWLDGAIVEGAFATSGPLQGEPLDAPEEGVEGYVALASLTFHEGDPAEGAGQIIRGIWASLGIFVPTSEVADA